ncbi:MAG: radical SAM protein [Nanoarchaeota archaeon]|nr:radical SAM protein [Nanoarchaeota archaeon]
MTNRSLVQLVKAPLPSDSANCLRSGAYPPYNLTSIATYLKEKSDLDVQIIDGEILSLDEIIASLHPQGIIGISSTSLAYPAALKIAQASKEKDSFVILGGIHAYHLPNEILESRKFIDVVVHGQGEEAFRELVNGENIHNIPNITFRDKNKIVSNPSRVINQRDLPFPNFSLVSDLNRYFQNFQKHYGYKRKDGKGLPVYSSSGCLYRLKTGGCEFCSIPNQPYSIVRPEQYWRIVERLNQEFGANFIWDISDTYTSNKEWVRRVSESKPKGISTSFNVYGRVDDINPEMLGYLKKIGVLELLLGVESFYDPTLKSINKGYTAERAKQSLRLLREFGINVELSLVLGNTGETEESLKRTLEICETLQELDNIDENHCSILIPLPGSKVYRKLMEDLDLRKKYGRDLIDYERLQIEFLDRYTLCGASKVFEYYNKIEKLFNPAGAFYSPKNSQFYTQGRFRDDLA